MFTEQYHNVNNRDGWPEGPWNGEPDKAVWVDETTGLDCMIVRNSVGALCGYVDVGPDHPWHKVDYSACLEGCGEGYCSHDPGSRVDVHGGLTFSDLCQPSEQGPEYGVCHIAQPGRPDPVWWFGFDCAHSWDLAPRMGRSGGYRDLGYVRAEVAALARQLKAVEA